MKVLVRTDANLSIGTGHLSRCRVLAQQLRQRGCDLLFVCRGLEERLSARLRAEMFSVVVLENPATWRPDSAGPPYASWLGVSLDQDANDTLDAMHSHGWRRADWVVVDHYALDAAWERRVRAYAAALIAVDDLADRAHFADIILDQNLRKDGGGAYRQLVPASATLLCGPHFALLRNEFAARERRPLKNRLFVSFGGADAEDYTGRTLDALYRPALEEMSADVVVSSRHPALTRLRVMAANEERIRLHVDAERISDYMVQAELAVGAGGVMTWERCAVGLPAAAVTIAENQAGILGAVSDTGAVRLLSKELFDNPDGLAERIASILADDKGLKEMSVRARALCDAYGAVRVAGLMMSGGNVTEARKNA